MSHSHDHTHDESHSHDNGMYAVDPTHEHPPQPDIEDFPLTRHQLTQLAVEELLIEKGILSAEEMRAQIEHMDEISFAQGSRLIARAWVDEAFKTRLLNDSHAAALELGLDVGPIPILVMENTTNVHNVIVCTLCSCYPWPTLGLPPVWYKSAPYRSRVVIDPRSVLAEFGVSVPADKEIRVWDSSAELRYLVLPERPEGTEGWTEDQLAELVTRDSMIGTGLAKTPSDIA